MPLIQIPQNVRPCQVEFGTDVERSKPGALYFTPSSTKKITEAEGEGIKKHNPQLAASLVVLPFDESKGRLAKQKAAEAPAAEQPKRAKDNMSKAKQKAEELLKKGAVKVAPAPKAKKVEAVAVAPEPMPEPEPEPDDEGGGKKKKKWG